MPLRPLSVVERAVGFLSACVVILAFGPAAVRPAPPPPKPTVPEYLSVVACKERQLADAAWKRALALAGLPPGADVPHPQTVRVIYEARWYPNVEDGLTRVCGRTEWYFLRSAESHFTVSADVQVFIAPGDCSMLSDTLTHEFLHVIRAFTNGGPRDDDEEWVRARLPVDCH